LFHKPDFLLLRVKKWNFEFLWKRKQFEEIIKF
jgi:hypothetical protein